MQIELLMLDRNILNHLGANKQALVHFKIILPTNYLFTNHLFYMYKQDLA